MKIALIIFSVVILGLLSFLAYLGFFKRPVITTKVVGPYKIIYKDHVGPYQETGKIQDDIYEYLIKEHNLETYKGIGVYYDNPKKVPAEKLRSKAGCIIEPKDMDQNIRLTGTYKVMTIAGQPMIYAEFPFKSKLSIMVGIMKVYPLLESYCEQKDLKFRESMEIYDIPNKKIVYLMPTK